MQSVGDPSALGLELIAGGHEELEVVGGCCGHHLVQGRLAQHDPGDRKGVGRVRLPATPQVTALPVGERGRHLDHHLPGSQEAAGEGRAETPRALDAEPAVGTQQDRPGEQTAVPLRVVGERGDRELTSQLVDGATRECGLVGVDADGHHRRALLRRLDHAQPGGQPCVRLCREATLLSGHARRAEP